LDIGIERRKRECYINMGAVDKRFFAREAMLRAAE
jgi:hypothetical protein